MLPLDPFEVTLDIMVQRFRYRFTTYLQNRCPTKVLNKIFLRLTLNS